MQVLIGGALGCAVGAAVWFVTHYFVCQYQAQHPSTSPILDISTLRGADGSAAILAVLLVAGMVLWGGYVGWQSAALTRIGFTLVVTGLLVTISLVDFRVRRIPNPLIVAVLLCAVSQSLCFGQPTLVSAALGLAVGGGIYLVLALIGRGAMGAGDVKLAAALGAVLGYPLILPGLFWGVIAGGVAALWLLATRRAGRKDNMAYGPYVAIGAWIVWTRSLGLWL